MSFLTSLPASLARIDVPRLVTNLDGLVRMHGAHAHQAPMDVVFARSKRPPFTQMSTCMLESPRIEKAILSHVRAAPFFAGVSVVVHPKADAPSLVSDLRIAPGRVRLYVDVCGHAVSRPEFMKRFHQPLARLLDRLPSHVKKTATPSWIASLSGGCGAQLRVGARAGRDLEHLMLDYVDTYLIALDQAEPGSHGDFESLGSLFKVHGRAGHYLTRAFGSDFAAKYHALVWSGA
jgi:hypothetical protein